MSFFSINVDFTINLHPLETVLIRSKIITAIIKPSKGLLVLPEDGGMMIRQLETQAKVCWRIVAQKTEDTAKCRQFRQVCNKLHVTCSQQSAICARHVVEFSGGHGGYLVDEVLWKQYGEKNTLFKTCTHSDTDRENNDSTNVVCLASSLTRYPLRMVS